MSSRGAVIRDGHVTTKEYMLKDNKTVHDAKVLVGQSSKYHNLPDYAHSPSSKYIKENSDGSFREMRVYNENGAPILELGYHAEPKLTGNRHEKVLHLHFFDADLKRTLIGKVSTEENADIYSKYEIYLKEYGL